MLAVFPLLALLSLVGYQSYRIYQEVDALGIYGLPYRLFKLKVRIAQWQYPNLKYYYRAANDSIVAKKKDVRTYEAGNHQVYGNKFFVDENGFKYKSKDDYLRIKALNKKKILVIGGSVAFGFSPFGVESFTDILNSMQDKFVFLNRTMPGMSGGGFNPILGDILRNDSEIAGIMVYEAINFLPIRCLAELVSKSEAGYELYKKHLRRRLAIIENYTGEAFAKEHLAMIDIAKQFNLPIFIVKFMLSYDENNTNSLYDLMVNSQCNAKFQLKLIRTHNASYDDLKKKSGYAGLHVLDPTLDIFGRPEYFWDSCHFSPLGNKKMAEFIWSELNRATLS